MEPVNKDQLLDLVNLSACLPVCLSACLPVCLPSDLYKVNVINLILRT